MLKVPIPKRVWQAVTRATPVAYEHYLVEYDEQCLEPCLSCITLPYRVWQAVPWATPVVYKHYLIEYDEQCLEPWLSCMSITLQSMTSSALSQACHVWALPYRVWRGVPWARPVMYEHYLIEYDEQCLSHACRVWALPYIVWQGVPRAMPVMYEHYLIQYDEECFEPGLSCMSITL